MNNATKVVAGVIALTAFVVAGIAGLGAGNAAEITLIRAIFAMFICYFAGLPLGMICEHVIQEHITDYAAGHPDSGTTSTGGTSGSKRPEGSPIVDEEVIVV